LKLMYKALITAIVVAVVLTAIRGGGADAPWVVAIFGIWIFITHFSLMVAQS
jgi:hypothetical protein